MPNLTLSIPEALQEKMRKHSEIRWSEVVRKSILEKIDGLEMLDKLTRKSKLTQANVDEIASKINKDAFAELSKR
ncbi:MAG TPA: hypothetical protein VI564_04865 [Candidatus Nanoarchaeia archaeon]|nr:hypothetical protein [Candidatus Nanoarchaeia archaeon]